MHLLLETCQTALFYWTFVISGPTQHRYDTHTVDGPTFDIIVNIDGNNDPVSI